MHKKRKVYPENSAIKYWAEDDRPREKLEKKGKSNLSNSELLAIILGSGNRESNAVDLAKKILESCNQNLIELSKLGIHQLKKFKGIGSVKAITIEAALELGRRRQESLAMEKEVISSSGIAYELVRAKLQDLNHEEFWVLYLNRANKKIAMENLSKGGITGTVADSRLIFTKALEIKATGVILVHNHPSGSVKPSTQDIELTKKMKTAGQTLDIGVLDHLIIAEDKYFSFADEGMM
ncbi:MAG: DNA repair protein RadC [Saprospiraceae bacterium]